LAELDVGFRSRDKIGGIRIQDEICQGWSTRRVAIASGEMYPEWGIFISRSSTRWVADKRSFGNPGDGMEVKARYRRRGADPPKNESGRTGPYENTQIANLYGK
jgi:hypothetical protein